MPQGDARFSREAGHATDLGYTCGDPTCDAVMMQTAALARPMVRQSGVAGGDVPVTGYDSLPASKARSVPIGAPGTGSR